MDQKWYGKKVTDIEQDPIFYFSFRQKPHTSPGCGGHPSIPNRHIGIGNAAKQKVKDQETSKYDAEDGNPFLLSRMGNGLFLCGLIAYPKPPAIDTHDQIIDL